MPDATTPSPDETGASPAGSDDHRWAVGVALLFLAVIGFVTLNHEPWRDEWQAWMIARDSTSLVDLMLNVRHEGHPFGWYLPLYLLARVTRDVIAMQLFHVALASGAVYVLARFAPLPRYQKLLIICGYFIAFEYAVIARAYALGMLALFSFCALFPRRQQHAALLAMALLVLASSSLYGLVLAMAAVGALGVEAVRIESGNPFRGSPRRRAFAVSSAITIGVFLALLAPAAERYVATRWDPTHLVSRWSIASSVAKVTEAYLPFPDVSAAQLWSSTLLSIDSRATLAAAMLAAIGMLCIGALMFVRKPAALFYFAAGTAGLLLFDHFVFSGSLRHLGQLYLVFVASLWLARLPVRERTLPPRLRRWSGPDTPVATAFTVVLLSVHVAAAVLLLAADLRRPFSAAPEAVRVLRAQGLDALPMAASNAPSASPLAGLLDRPVLYLDVGRSATFVPWQSFRGHPGWPVMLERLRTFVDASGGDVVLVTSTGIGMDDPSLDIEPIARIEAGIVSSERYVLYRVRRAAH